MDSSMRDVTGVPKPSLAREQPGENATFEKEQGVEIMQAPEAVLLPLVSDVVASCKEEINENPSCDLQKLCKEQKISTNPQAVQELQGYQKARIQWEKKTVQELKAQIDKDPILFELGDEYLQLSSKAKDEVIQYSETKLKQLAPKAQEKALPTKPKAASLSEEKRADLLSEYMEKIRANPKEKLQFSPDVKLDIKDKNYLRQFQIEMRKERPIERAATTGARALVGKRLEKGFSSPKAFLKMITAPFRKQKVAEPAPLQQDWVVAKYTKDNGEETVLRVHEESSGVWKDDQGKEVDPSRIEVIKEFSFATTAMPERAAESKTERSSVEALSQVYSAYVAKSAEIAGTGMKFHVVAKGPVAQEPLFSENAEFLKDPKKLSVRRVVRNGVEATCQLRAKADLDKTKQQRCADTISLSHFGNVSIAIVGDAAGNDKESRKMVQDDIKMFQDSLVEQLQKAVQKEAPGGQLELATLQRALGEAAVTTSLRRTGKETSSLACSLVLQAPNGDKYAVGICVGDARVMLKRADGSAEDLTPTDFARHYSDAANSFGTTQSRNPQSPPVPFLKKLGPGDALLMGSDCFGDNMEAKTLGKTPSMALQELDRMGRLDGPPPRDDLKLLAKRARENKDHWLNQATSPRFWSRGGQRDPLTQEQMRWQNNVFTDKERVALLQDMHKLYSEYVLATKTGDISATLHDHCVTSPLLQVGVMGKKLEKEIQQKEASLKIERMAPKRGEFIERLKKLADPKYDDKIWYTPDLAKGFKEKVGQHEKNPDLLYRDMEGTLGDILRLLEEKPEKVAAQLYAVKKAAVFLLPKDDPSLPTLFAQWDKDPRFAIDWLQKNRTQLEAIKKTLPDMNTKQDATALIVKQNFENIKQLACVVLGQSESELADLFKEWESNPPAAIDFLSDNAGKPDDFSLIALKVPLEPLPDVSRPISLKYSADTQKEVHVADDTCLDEMHDWGTGAMLKSTTYHDKAKREAPNRASFEKEPEFTSDFARYRRLPNGTQCGVICDGLDHLHCASGAARQISHQAMELLNTKYQILPSDSKEAAEAKLKALAKDLQDYTFETEATWERDPTLNPASALLLYVVLPPKEPGGKSRLVGLNIGDSSLIVYRKDGTVTPVSEPDQRCTIINGQPKWNPVFTTKLPENSPNKTGLADESDVRVFDLSDIETGDVVIPCSDGLFDAVSLPHDDESLFPEMQQTIDDALLDEVTPDSFKEDLRKLRQELHVIQHAMSKLTSPSDIENKKIEAFKAFEQLLGNHRNKALTKDMDPQVVAAARARFEHSQFLAYVPENTLLKEATLARIRYQNELMQKPPNQQRLDQMMMEVQKAERAVFKAKAQVIAAHLNDAKQTGSLAPRDICRSLFELADATLETKRKLLKEKERLEAEIPKPDRKLRVVNYKLVKLKAFEPDDTTIQAITTPLQPAETLATLLTVCATLKKCNTVGEFRKVMHEEFLPLYGSLSDEQKNQVKQKMERFFFLALPGGGSTLEPLLMNGRDSDTLEIEKFKAQKEAFDDLVAHIDSEAKKKKS